MLYNWTELKPENIAVLDMKGNLVENEYIPTCEIPCIWQFMKHVPKYR
jgi:ribulose-5-phosphate 4-epimerase/fuculose-1-phosphate aldolase